MIIIPYVVQQCIITAEFARSRICWYCDSEFVQFGEIRVVGRHSTLFGMFEREAKRQARINAETRWPYKCIAWNPPVPCPQCNCFQQDMYQEIRANRRNWLKYVGAILAFPSIIASSLLLSIILTGELTRAGCFAFVGAALVVSASPFAFLYRGILNARFIPNTLNRTQKLKLTKSNAWLLKDWTKPMGVHEIRYRSHQKTEYDL